MGVSGWSSVVSRTVVSVPSTGVGSKFKTLGFVLKSVREEKGRTIRSDVTETRLTSHDPTRRKKDKREGKREGPGRVTVLS